MSSSHDIIYTDESTFWVENNARYYHGRVGTANKKVGKPKHPYKVPVWGGVSRRRTTRLAIFDGTMRKEFFTDELLQQHLLLPFIREAYPEGCRLMMDNDPKHSSQYAMEFMRENNINQWRNPAESPDANLIEHIWGNMKVYKRRHDKPRTKDQLIAGLKYCRTTPPTREQIERHLNNVYHV